MAERAWRAEGYDDIEALDGALRAAMYAASRGEQLALIRAHPDLGEKVAPLTDHSKAEQATLALSPADFDRFATTNAAYKAKFEIPFVICVREHTKESILANADARLGNTVEQEIQTALGEIAKIARLRLEDAF